MIEENNRPADSPPMRERTRAVPRSDVGHALLRTLLFTWFTLLDYVRSGRIWIELGAAAAFYVVLLRGEVDPEKFFSLTSLFTIVLTIYTMSSVIGLGDRPQSYLILARQVGRTGFLLGLYAVAVIILITVYLLISLLTVTLSNLVGMTFAQWVLGTLPLLLNIGLLAALLLMMSPLVFSTGWRLFVLGLIALAFSGPFLGNATLDSLAPFVRQLILSMQTILGWPLVPAFSGFTLAVSRDYSSSAPAILVSQMSLLTALLGISLYAFSRRELMLTSE